MAQGNVELAEGAVFGNTPTKKYAVAASATLIYAGEPVKFATSEDAVVVKCADAEPIAGTTPFVGIAATDSTNTASAAGVVFVYEALPGQAYLCNAKDSTAINTQAKYDALVGERIAFDLASTTFTVDTTSGGATDGLFIIANDITRNPGKVKFEIRRTSLESN